MPTFWLPKLIPGESFTMVPLPDNATVCGLPSASSVTDTVPVASPFSNGTNSTWIWQFPLTGRLAGQTLTAYQKGVWYATAFFWTVVIWVMEVRSTKHAVRRMRSKRQLEGESDADLSKKWTLINATNAVALVYVLSCLAWAVQLVQVWGTCVLTVWIVVIAWAVLFVFTLREYWTLLRDAVQKWRL